MKRLRVGIMTRPLDKGVSGSGMHMERILRLITKKDCGIDWFFIHHVKNHYPFYDAGQEVFISRNPIIASIQLRRLNLDVMHYNPLTMFAPIFLPGVKKTTTIHGDAEHFIPHCFSLARRIHAKLVVPAYTRLMDFNFVVSKTTFGYAEKQYRIPPEKMALTFNAIDERFHAMDSSVSIEVRERFCSGSRFLLTLCNFSPRKNPWTILKAIESMREFLLSNGLKFVLIGNGWNKSSDVKAFIQKAELKEIVVTPGFVDTEDVPKLMNAAEVFVFPSLYEGFGMPNLEAMACGCPVVTSSVFSIPEVVADAALCVDDPLDVEGLVAQILRVLEDRELRASLVSKGLQRCQAFSWEESAAVWENSFKGLCRK